MKDHHYSAIAHFLVHVWGVTVAVVLDDAPIALRLGLASWASVCIALVGFKLGMKMTEDEQ